MQLTELGDMVINNTRHLRIGFNDTQNDKRLYLAVTEDGNIEATEVRLNW